MLAGRADATILEMPAAAAFYVGGSGVLLGAIAMTCLADGRTGRVDLARRAVVPRLASAGWWLFVVAWYPAITLAAAALTGIASMARQWTRRLRSPSWPTQPA